MEWRVFSFAKAGPTYDQCPKLYYIRDGNALKMGTVIVNLL